MAAASPYDFKSILWETLFLDKLSDFSLLSWNSFLHPFMKSKFPKKKNFLRPKYFHIRKCLILLLLFLHLIKIWPFLTFFVNLLNSDDFWRPQLEFLNSKRRSKFDFLREFWPRMTFADIETFFEKVRSRASFWLYNSPYFNEILNLK